MPEVTLPAIESIEKAETLRKWAAGHLVSEVERARREGHNWDEIALALGITRQSAMSRYARRIEKIDLRSRPWSRRWPDYATKGLAAAMKRTNVE
jgi:hypothetical protein